MNFNFVKLTENEYRNSPLPILFENTLGERSYAEISCNDFKYKLSWQSDLLDPDFIELKNGIYAIGIDLNFSIVDFNSNKIINSIQLDYFLSELIIQDNFLYVISEMEIIEINIESMRIVNKYDLPDTYESISFNNNSARVECMNGEVKVINYSPNR